MLSCGSDSRSLQKSRGGEAENSLAENKRYSHHRAGSHIGGVFNEIAAAVVQKHLACNQLPPNKGFVSWHVARSGSMYSPLFYVSQG